MSVSEDSEKLFSFIKAKDLEATSNLLNKNADLKLICETEVNKIVWPRENNHRDSLSCLHYAAKKGRCEILEYIFQQQIENSKYEVDVNLATSILGWTPLHYVGHGGSFITMKLLIKQGASINAVAKDGKTPIQVAIQRCSKRVAVGLINSGSDVNIVDSRGQTLLHVCLEALKESRCTPSECLEMTEFLMIRNTNPSIANHDGDLPLHLAIRNNVETKLIKLLASSLKRYGKDCINAVNSMGFAPIHLCSNVDQVQTLLDYGADINLPYDDGRTLLHMQTDNLDIVKCIVSKQGDLLAVDNHGQIPLHLAVLQTCPNLDVIRILSSEYNYVTCKDNSGESVLHKVCTNNYRKIKYYDDDLGAMNVRHLNIKEDPILEFLVSETGVDVNDKNKLDQTPLHFSLKRRFYQKAAILIRNGADVDIVDSKRVTPRMINPGWIRMSLINLDHSDVDSQYTGDLQSMCSGETATTILTTGATNPNLHSPVISKMKNNQENKRGRKNATSALPEWIDENNTKNTSRNNKTISKPGNDLNMLDREVTLLKSEVKDMHQFLEEFSKEGVDKVGTSQKTANNGLNNKPSKNKITANAHGKGRGTLDRELTKLHDEVNDLNKMLQEASG